MVVFAARRTERKVIRGSLAGPESKVPNYKYDCNSRWNHFKALGGRSFSSVGEETVEKASGGPGAVHVNSRIEI